MSMRVGNEELGLKYLKLVFDQQGQEISPLFAGEVFHEGDRDLDKSVFIRMGKIIHDFTFCVETTSWI